MLVGDFLSPECKKRVKIHNSLNLEEIYVSKVKESNGTVVETSLSSV